MESLEICAASSTKRSPPQLGPPDNAVLINNAKYLHERWHKLPRFLGFHVSRLNYLMSNAIQVSLKFLSSTGSLWLPLQLSSPPLWRGDWHPPPVPRVETEALTFQGYEFIIPPSENLSTTYPNSLHPAELRTRAGTCSHLTSHNNIKGLSSIKYSYWVLRE